MQLLSYVHTFEYKDSRAFLCVKWEDFHVELADELGAVHPGCRDGIIPALIGVGVLQLAPWTPREITLARDRSERTLFKLEITV